MYFGYRISLIKMRSDAYLLLNYHIVLPLIPSLCKFRHMPPKIDPIFLIYKEKRGIKECNRRFHST